MKNSILLILCILYFSSIFSQHTVNIMLITSERKKPVSEFYQLFDSIHGLHYTEYIQPSANESIEKGKAYQYDLLVFYDLYDSITNAQKKAYWQLLESGKPMIFLHHTLVSYQNWPEFTKIVGGKYFREHPVRGPSTFEHDIKLSVDMFDLNSIITKGLTSFEITDESYDNCFILPQVTPLLKTTTKNNMPYPAWIHQVKKAEVIYIQFGHDANAFTNPNYQKLITQSIKYLVGKNK